MNTDKLLSNKKLLLVIAAILLAILIIAILLLFPHKSSSPNDEDLDYTDDSAYIQYTDTINDYITKNHPIDQLLPIRNQSPFYYIALIIDSNDSGDFAASIEISYYTTAGKSAAEARLKSAEFAKYHPENYHIIYTQLTTN